MSGGYRMAGSDDGKGYAFSMWNLYPLLSDYDRAWSFDGIAMLKFIEERCFFLFLGWFNAEQVALVGGRQGELSAANPRNRAAEDGWMVGQPS